MGLEAVTYLNDLVNTNPLSSDPRSEGDDHLRNIKTALQNTFPGMAGAAWRVQTKAATYTPVATDNMTLFDASAAITLNITAAATLGNKWLTLVYARGGDVTLDPNASEQINGAAAFTLRQGWAAILICTGTAFYVFPFPVSSYAVLESLFTTKGDTAVATGASTVVRKGVPSDGFQRFADSTQTDGWSDRAPATMAASGRNITARTNSVSPLSKVDMAADELVIKSSTGGARLLTNVSVTADITASSTNGLDTGAEASDTWYYGWVIYNPSTDTTAALLSTSATAPTMPSGYTEKALVTAVHNSGTDFVAYRQFGKRVFYEGEQVAFNGSMPTSETAIDVSAIVPPIAESFFMTCEATVVATAANGAFTVNYRYISGSDYFLLKVVNGAGSNQQRNTTTCGFPNVGQQYYHHRTSSFGLSSASARETIQAFILP